MPNVLRCAEEVAVAKKIIVVLGSPRPKGNSVLLAESAVRGASELGATCETVRLQGMRIAPCRACDSCRRPIGSGCAIKDDMQELYPRLVAADALLLAGPIYWFAVCAQTKLFLDRCYALHTAGGHALGGKRFGVILTYGDSDAFASGGINAVRMFQDACRYLEAALVGVVHGTAGDAGEVAHNQPLLDEALELGRALAR
jgi:multimeric flavodoxin WrbA